MSILTKNISSRLIICYRNYDQIASATSVPSLVDYANETVQSATPTILAALGTTAPIVKEIIDEVYSAKFCFVVFLE